MKRLLYLIPLLLLAALPARAQLANAQGWCENGATIVVTSGLSSTNTVQGSFPSCSVAVSIHGGGIATIFSTGAGAPLSNPFTATTTGRWLFYAANGEYDITMTGGGLTSPVTYSDVFIGTGGGGGGGVTSVTATSPIVATPNPITSAGTISCPTCNTSGATIAGSISAGQVAVGSAPNTISGSANLTYTSQDLILLNSAANTLTLQNSTAANSGTNQSSPIALAIGNYWTGAASAQDIYTFQDIVSAGNNPVTSLNFGHSGSSGGGNYGFAGNVNVSNSLTAANATVTGIGSLIIKGTGSGQAAIGVPTNAGTPNSLNLPTTTGTSGQFLQTDGGNPQQLSWQSVIGNCTPTGGIAFQNGTPNILTCESQFLWNSTNHALISGPPTSSFDGFTSGFLTTPFDGTNSFRALNASAGFGAAVNAVMQDNLASSASVLNPINAILELNNTADAPTGSSYAAIAGAAYINNGTGNFPSSSLVQGVVGLSEMLSNVNADQMYGVIGSAQAYGTGTINRLVGVFGNYGLGNASGTATEMDGFYGTILGGDMGHTTINAVFHAADPTTFGTNNYAFLADTTSVASNVFSFYDAALTNKARFGNIYHASLSESTTAPSIAGAGCGGSGATISSNNGTVAFRVDIGTSNTGTCTITMPAATTGWNCQATNLTNKNTNQATVQETSASNTTTLVLQNYTDVMATHAMTDSDTLAIICFGE